MMNMHEEMNKSLEEMKNAVDQQLKNLGMLDTVNEFLNTKEAKDAVLRISTSWLEGLKVFAAKMPAGAETATGKYLEMAEESMKSVEEFTSLMFKRHMSGVFKQMLDTTTIEVLQEKLQNLSPAVKQLWLGILGKEARDMIDDITMPVKVDIAEKAFFTFEKDADVEAFYQALKSEPDGDELVANVDMRLSLRMLRSEVALLGSLFYGMRR